MRVGDLVIRKVMEDGCDLQRKASQEQRDRLGHGIVLSKQMFGKPKHPCVSVYYPKVGKIYDIAEALMHVIGRANYYSH